MMASELVRGLARRRHREVHGVEIERSGAMNFEEAVRVRGARPVVGGSEDEFWRKPLVLLKIRRGFFSARSF